MTAQERRRTVFFISGNTAISAETIGMSLLSQFDAIRFEPVSLPFVNTPAKARKAIARINRAARDGGPPVVFSTLVDEDIRGLVRNCDCVFIDFFDAFLTTLERTFGEHPAHIVGRYHGLDDFAEYDLRIDAINYALGSDDGLSVKKYDQAELILLGVSRTGKTPVCLYLAFHYGIHAANYPLTEDNLAETPRLPPALAPFRETLYGLTINPDRLEQIRARRRPGSVYASLAQCRKEIARAEALYAAEKIPSVNITNMSVEEIAVTVLEESRLQRRVV